MRNRSIETHTIPCLKDDFFVIDVEENLTLHNQHKLLGTLGMLMITTPIFVPAIMALGYDPIWFGIIAIKMCEIAWITPPIALNVYIAQAITKELSLERAFKAILPFLACDILTLILFIAFPQIILFLPDMMAG